MKKLLLHYGLLVIANITISILMAISFGIYLLLQAPIMAAIPALLALPGLLLQPWCFLVLLVPRFFWASPFVMSLVTLGVYRNLNRQRRFQDLLQRVPRLTISQGVWTWWRPHHNATTQYFSTHEVPFDSTSPGGFQAIALWNSGDQSFYLWYKSLF